MQNVQWNVGPDGAEGVAGLTAMADSKGEARVRVLKSRLVGQGLGTAGDTNGGEISIWQQTGSTISRLRLSRGWNVKTVSGYMATWMAFALSAAIVAL